MSLLGRIILHPWGFEIVLFLIIYAPHLWLGVLIFLLFFRHYFLFLVAIAGLLYSLFNGAEYRVKEYEGETWWNHVRNGFVKYFPVRLHASDNVLATLRRITHNGDRTKPSRKLIFRHSPHGFMGISSNVLAPSEFERLLGYAIPLKALVASIVFKEKYVEELRRLHEEYKDRFGREERTLKIL